MYIYINVFKVSCVHGQFYRGWGTSGFPTERGGSNTKGGAPRDFPCGCALRAIETAHPPASSPKDMPHFRVILIQLLQGLF